MRRMILVANERFDEEPALTNLTCPKNDVTKLAELLKDRRYGQFQDHDILIDKTHSEIERSLNKVFCEAQKDDFILFFYSGHGKINTAGELFLCTNDTRLDEIEFTAVSASSIKAIIAKTACRKIGLIMDCCFSGKMGDIIARGGNDEPIGDLISDIEVKERGGKGTFLLTSSTATQQSYEKGTEGHGIFTNHLINGIKNGEADSDRDGYVTFDELHEYLCTKMEKEQERTQTPSLWAVNVQKGLYVSKHHKLFCQIGTGKIEEKLRSIKSSDMISDGLYFEYMGLLLKYRKGLCSKEEEELLEEFATGRIKVGDMQERFRSANTFATDFEEIKMVPTAPLDIAGKRGVGRLEGVAPPDFGAYSKIAVEAYIGDYVCVRRSFLDRHALYVFPLQLKWSKKYDYLYFKELDERREFKQQGYVFIPLSSPTMSLVTLSQGAVRHILLSKPDLKGRAMGVISTASNPVGDYFVPMMSAIVFVREDCFDGKPMFGKLTRESDRFVDYRDLLLAAEERAVGDLSYFNKH